MNINESVLQKEKYLFKADLNLNSRQVSQRIEQDVLNSSIQILLRSSL